MEKCPAFSAERRHVLTFTPTYTVIHADVHLVLPSLSHIVSTHKSTQKKSSASSFRKVALEQRQNTWMKSYLKCNMLLNCIKSCGGVPEFIKLLVCVQIQTHHCQVSAFSTTCSYTSRTCNKSTKPKYGPAIYTKYFPNASKAHHNYHETTCKLLLMNITHPKIQSLPVCN